MKADKRIAGARCSPETLKVISKAFDDAWAEIEPHFYGTPTSADAARLKLADEVLAIACEDSRDPDEVKNLALQAMAMRCSTGFGMIGSIGQRVHSPQYWWNYAEETHAMAEQMKDPECKRLLVGVAETYAQLARHADAQEISGKRRDGAA